MAATPRAVAAAPARADPAAIPPPPADTAATVRRFMPSRRAISRSDTPPATSARTCAHSNALGTTTPLARHSPAERASRDGPDAISGAASGALSRCPIPVQYRAPGITVVDGARRTRTGELLGAIYAPSLPVLGLVERFRRLRFFSPTPELYRAA
jgi:hypothetical protein